MNPLVTVVIPAHNRPEMLTRAIKSVLAQTFRDFELIVVNDASDLNSADFSNNLTWLKNKENLGPAATRNRGAAAGVGKWIAFLDSDDRWLPEKLARQIAHHEINSELRISQCEEIWIRNGKHVRKPAHLAQPSGHIFEECTNRCCISPSAVMIRRDLWDETGGFDEFFRICEDYEYWLRIARDNPIGLVEGKDLVEKYGGHPDQLSGNVPHGIDRWRVLALLSILEHGLENNAQFTAAQTALHEKSRIAAKRFRPTP